MIIYDTRVLKWSQTTKSSVIHVVLSYTLFHVGHGGLLLPLNIVYMQHVYNNCMYRY